MGVYFQTGADPIDTLSIQIDILSIQIDTLSIQIELLSITYKAFISNNDTYGYRRHQNLK